VPAGFPDPETLAACERFALWLRQGGGLPVRGRPLSGGLSAGLDFEGHAEYRPGHDLRHLDWALYARLRTLNVRTFEDEGAGTLAVLLDASASMAHGGKFELARRMAAALVFAGLRACHGVLLGVAREGALDALPLTGGAASFDHAMAWLARVEPGGKTHLAASFAAAPRFAARGDAVILSDLFDPHGPEGALDALHRAGWQADLVRITTPEEWWAPAPGLGLRDPESNAAATAPADTGALTASLTAWREQTRAQALRRGSVVVEVDASAGLPQALTRFFSTVLAVRSHV
jgi:uncharacterized protein (DUF58 family)